MPHLTCGTSLAWPTENHSKDKLLTTAISVININFEGLWSGGITWPDFYFSLGVSPSHFQPIWLLSDTNTHTHKNHPNFTILCRDRRLQQVLPFKKKKKNNLLALCISWKTNTEHAPTYVSIQKCRISFFIVYTYCPSGVQSQWCNLKKAINPNYTSGHLISLFFCKRTNRLSGSRLVSIANHEQLSSPIRVWLGASVDTQGADRDTELQGWCQLAFFLFFLVKSVSILQPF